MGSPRTSYKNEQTPDSPTVTGRQVESTELLHHLMHSRVRLPLTNEFKLMGQVQHCAFSKECRRLDRIKEAHMCFPSSCKTLYLERSDALDLSCAPARAFSSQYADHQAGT